MVTKEGTLLKWVNIFSGWKNRYFILKGNVLSYKESADSKSKAAINLEDAEIEMVKGDPTKILLTYGAHKIQIKTSTIVEKMEWINALREAKSQEEEKQFQDSDRKKATPFKKPESGALSKDEDSPISLSQDLQEPHTANKETIKIHHKPQNSQNVQNVQNVQSSQNSQNVENKANKANKAKSPNCGHLRKSNTLSTTPSKPFSKDFILKQQIDLISKPYYDSRNPDGKHHDFGGFEDFGNFGDFGDFGTSGNSGAKSENLRENLQRVLVPVQQEAVRREVDQIVRRRFISEHNVFARIVMKIWSMGSQLEDNLALYVAKVNELTQDPEVLRLGEKLEGLADDLKVVVGFEG